MRSCGTSRVGRWGPRTPGCLTSEDEERETWTAESLRISNTWKLRFSTFGIGRKTSAVHVLKRLHHRRQRCESRAINMVGPRQTLRSAGSKFQVQLESLILAQSERWRQ